jgi:hypothetical protein
MSMPDRLRRATWLLPLAAAAATAIAAPLSAVRDAEYAVRWDPRQGGPATPEEALRGLRLQPSAPRRFEVQYFDFAPPPGLLPGFDAILRQRLGAGEAEWTFKLRGSGPPPAAPALSDWVCPLGPARHTPDRKDEADITFVGAGQVHTTYSRSCSRSARDTDLPPPTLQARPKGCGSTMTRWRSGKLKVELWRLADGSALLEASRPGRHDQAALQAFERQVLKPLLALHVQPLQRSKSAIGGDCTK